MSKKLELSLSRDYVPSWGIVEAVRELFQNALDQETVNPTSNASWEYDSNTCELTITTSNAVLDRSTLLLGITSKSDKPNTIGQFGEGYKIAALVLTRIGKELTIHCEAENEIWKPRFVKSRRYNADVLTFFIDKTPKTRSNNLKFVVAGVTEEEWIEQIIPSILHLRDDISVLATTRFGDILDDIPGLIFVNGLLVTTYPAYKCSYDFKPGLLKLDRDRKLVSDFDLKWLASKMWNEIDNIDKMNELLKCNAADVAYLADASMYSKAKYAPIHTAFIEEHGANAVPVTTQYEANEVPSTHKAVIVPESLQKVITSSPAYVAPPVEVEEEEKFDAVLELQAWYDNYHDMLPIGADEELQEIINKMQEA